MDATNAMDAMDAMDARPATAPPLPGRDSASYLAILRRLHGRLRRGLFGARLGGAAALLLSALALAGLSDYLFGWETAARSVLAAALVTTALAGIVAAWLRASRTPLEEIATRGDRALRGPRRELRTALDLARSPAEEGGLEAYLSEIAVRRAEVAATRLKARALLPSRELRRAWRPALLALAALLALVAVHPRAAGTVAERLARPGADLPPYSPYRFALSARGEGEGPRVIYGRELVLVAEVEGPASQHPVELLLRPAGGGAAERFPTFREGGALHSRKLEGVTEELDFAFAVGRARSAWNRVEILYQPRLERAGAALDPPAYSKLPASRFELGAEDLRGLRGTAVRLEVESNRPLSGGVMEGRAPGGEEVLSRVEGSVVPPAGADAPAASSEGRLAAFEWEINADLVWTLDLADLRGGRMEEPVVVAQRLVPDERPRVDLLEPGPFALATPGSALELAWEVQDDLGLERLVLFRSAEKFRDRPRNLPEGPGERRLRIERTELLSNLGVRPGQTLEFLLEARDHNPSLLGVGTAPPAVVSVISEEEYAERIRLRTTLEEFSARYRILREGLEAALSALEELAEAAASGDAGRVEAAVAEAARAHREAAAWFGAFAKEFPAFATDEILRELSGDLLAELEANLDSLESGEALSGGDAAAMAAAMAARLRPGAAQLEAREREAADLASVAGLLEMAAELEAIREQQHEISGRLARLARELALGHEENRGDLATLRARQQRNHERLEKVMEALPDRLEGLPEGFESLAEGAAEVLEMLRSLQVAQQMDESVAQAGRGRVPAASEASALALANLDQILAGGDNDFCAVCQGGTPGFLSGDGLAAQALAQMMAALRGRAGGGGDGPPGEGGTGSGSIGMGGTGGSGYTMQGMQIDVPLIGPPRIDLSRPPAGGGGGTESDGPRGPAPEASAAAASALPEEEGAATAGASWTPESLPPKYRDAAIRFHSEGETLPPPSPDPDPIP